MLDNVSDVIFLLLVSTLLAFSILGKLKTRFILMSAGILIFLFCLSVSANLIENGGFEDIHIAAAATWPYRQADHWDMGEWWSDWLAWDVADEYYGGPNYPHSGLYAAWTDPNYQHEYWMENDAIIAPGDYTVTFWARAGRRMPNEEPFINARLGETILSFNLIDGWEQYSFRAIVLNPSKVGFQIIAAGDDSGWVDDVAVNHFPEMSGFLALLSSALGLIIIRRRIW